MFARLGRFLPPVIILVFFITLAGSSAAQSSSSVTLSTPDPTGFPYLTAYLDVHDTQGGFIHGLKPEQVTILEDTTSLPVSDIKEIVPGVQFVIAVSPGESFLIRDGEGVSRYEYFLRGFLSGSWASQPAGEDDYSLLTAGGPQLTHSANPAELGSLFETYVPTATTTAPGLEILASALQVASDPTAMTGMERAILFITPPQESAVSLGLQSIIASANQQNIHIFVWVLAATDVIDTPSVVQLRNLADQTRGSFFSFSRDEAIPDLQALLDPLRYAYQLGYNSQINTPGSHQFSAQVALDGGSISSPMQAFTVDLQPPTVMLIDPPTEIVRNFPVQPTPEPASAAVDLVPVTQTISIRVEYPDGYEHVTLSTNLYADGILVAQNTAGPYDEFVWDLRSYTQDSEHHLVAEATDNLGMVGKSSEATVKIIVPSPTQGMMATITQKRPLIIAAFVIILASLLVLVLIVGGRIRPKPHPGQRKPPLKNGQKSKTAGARLPSDNPGKPVSRTIKSQQMPNQPAAFRWMRWLDRLPWRKQKSAPTPAIAYLIPLAGYDEPSIPARLEIIDHDVSLGSDPHLASLVFSDSSIEGVHAHIHHEGHAFTIMDNKTVAGTWVNYIQAPPTGTTLEHMDIIHLGKIGFRFQLAEPGPLRRINVTPLEQRQ